MFCRDHKDHSSPALHHKQLEESSLAVLNRDKKNRQHDAELDGVFLVEEILDKKGDKYHIKWKGYTATTWEPSKNIPKFIRDFYERTGVSKLPKPRILDTRKTGRSIPILFMVLLLIFSCTGTVTEHLLAWDEEDTSLPEWTTDIDLEDDEDDDISSSCNTRKDRYILKE